MDSRVSHAVMVIKQSPTTAETMVMKPGMDSMSMAILRSLSLMRATSSALRAKKLVMLNAPGSAVLPLVTALLPIVNAACRSPEDVRSDDRRARINVVRVSGTQSLE